MLSECPNYKFVKYIGAARSEGLEFGSIDIQNLSVDYTVSGDKILPGLSTLKGIGKATAEKVIAVADEEPFKDLEDFLKRYGKDKTTLERVIKLGGFDNIFPNRKALWMWYLYCNATGKDITMLRKNIRHCYIWIVTGKHVIEST